MNAQIQIRPYSRIYWRVMSAVKPELIAQC
jgi:hypothetical protein